MKRTGVYSRSCSSQSYPNGGDGRPLRSFERGDAVGVPPSHTLPSLLPQSHSLPAGRRIGRHADYSRNTFHAANGSPHHVAAAAHHGMAPYFNRSASLTAITTPDDDDSDSAPHHAHHLSDHMIDRSLSHSVRSLDTDHFQEAAVFRSVGMHHPPTADWMAPPSLSHSSKNNAWLGGHHLSSGADGYDFDLSMKSPLMSSNGHDLSLKPPTLDVPSFGHQEEPQSRRHTSAPQYTTFETLNTICSQNPRVITPQPVPSWVEPHSTFQLVAAPAALALRIGRFLEERRVVFHFVAAECLFEARAATNGFQFAFYVTVYDRERERNGDEMECLVEFQRRQGDCMQFGALYRDAKAHLELPADHNRDATGGDSDEGEDDDEAIREDLRADVKMACAQLLCDNIGDDNELSPNRTLTEVDPPTLATLTEMINSNYFEEQFEATTAVARLTTTEANCRAILDDEASVSGLLASLHEKRDPRVQQGAATSVANLVSHSEHVPRGSLNVIVVALIALLLISTSLEVVRETARALVSLADLNQDFNVEISQSVGSVLEKLAATRDEVALGYRVELARKVGVTTPY